MTLKPGGVTDAAVHGFPSQGGGGRAGVVARQQAGALGTCSVWCQQIMKGREDSVKTVAVMSKDRMWGLERAYSVIGAGPRCQAHSLAA